MICGSVKIDDRSSNNDTSIKQYISMINYEMNNLLKQSKLYDDVIELDSKNNITEKLNVVQDRLKKLNKNVSATTDNDEIIC